MGCNACFVGSVDEQDRRSHSHNRLNGSGNGKSSWQSGLGPWALQAWSFQGSVRAVFFLSRLQVTLPINADAILS